MIWAPRLASLAVGLSAHSPRQARKLPCLWAIRYNPWRERAHILIAFSKLLFTKQLLSDGKLQNYK